MLIPPNADDVLWRGYQLHIKTLISEHDLSCIKSIVEKHNLAIADEPNKNLKTGTKRLVGARRI